MSLINKIKKKMKSYLYDFRLILFFIYRKILNVRSHAYSLAKYDVAIHQNSVLEKHFIASARNGRCRFFLFYPPRS